MFARLQQVVWREFGIMRKNRMYLFCMVVLPVIVVIFFTSLMSGGQPTDMPVGVVDLDNTHTTRTLVRKLDAFQATKVVKHYASVADARRDIQRNKIYAFIYIPEGTTDKLLSMRQPKISFYYSSTSYTAGALLYRDLKTISTLGSAGVGATLLSAKGLSEEQVMSFLQPVIVDLHTVNNPLVNYSVYLNTMLIPGCIMLFIFIVTAYSIGTELKFNSAKEWLDTSGGNIFVALMGKMLPQTVIFLIIMYAYMFYVFGVLHFPQRSRLYSFARRALGALVTGIRDFRLRRCSVITHVDEYMLLMGGSQLFIVGHGIPVIGYGLRDKSHCPAFPIEALLHDIPT